MELHEVSSKFKVWGNHSFFRVCSSIGEASVGIFTEASVVFFSLLFHCVAVMVLTLADTFNGVFWF